MKRRSWVGQGSTLQNGRENEAALFGAHLSSAECLVRGLPQGDLLHNTRVGLEPHCSLDAFFTLPAP